MDQISSDYTIDESNAKQLKAWLTAGKWSIQDATLLFLDIDPDRHCGECFATFSGHGSIRYDYYDDDNPSSQISFGVDDDGEVDYLTAEKRNLLNQTRSLWKEIERKLNLYESAVPQEWIDLALKKGVDIPWLAWAKRNNLVVSNEATTKPVKRVPVPGGVTPTWKSDAVKRATEIIERQRAKDLYPSQTDIADEIAKEFRAAGVMGAGGKPMRGTYIKRHALKGVSSESGKLRSTTIVRGK